MEELTIVSPDDARRLVGEGATLLDVRGDEEWRAGHAPGAQHVALADLPDELERLNREELVVCLCRSGARSRRAALFLTECGFRAANLEGGMLAWVETGGDLVADGDDPRVA